MKKEQLYKLKKEWAACERCPLSQLRKRVVFGQGNPEARLVMIGEVPGEDEDASTEDKPTAGMAGKIMHKLLSIVNINREDLWITNVCMCRPSSSGRKRAPKLDEITSCHPRLMGELEIIKPEIIVLAGNTPLYMATGKRGISKNRGWQNTVWTGKTFSTDKVFATLHPSSLLHGSKEQTEMKADWIKTDWLEIARIFLGKETGETTDKAFNIKNQEED